MNLLHRLGNAIDAIRAKSIDGSISAIWANTTSVSPPSASKIIRSGFNSNGTVYSLIRLLTQNATRAGWNVYKIKSAKHLQNYQKMKAPTIQKDIVRVKAIEEVEGTFVDKWFRSPNDRQTWTEFVAEAIGFKLLSGNRFIRSVGPDTGPNKGRPIVLQVLPSQFMEIKTNAEGSVSQYKLNVGREPQIFSFEEVKHSKYWNPNFDSERVLFGLSPLEAAAYSLLLSNTSYQSGANAIKNGGMKGIFTSKESGKLSMTQAQQVEDALIKKASGAANINKINVTSASLDWLQVGLSPVDLQLLEVMQFTKRDLCDIFNVQSQLLNDPENKIAANMTEARKMMFTDAVIPELISFRDDLNAILQRVEPTLFIDFDVSGIEELQADAEKKARVLASSWWIKGTEKRQIDGFGVDPEDEQKIGDYFIPGTLKPVSMAIAEGDGAIEAQIAELLRDQEQGDDE